MDEDLEVPVTKKNDGNEREANEAEPRNYSGVINGSSYSQHIMEDETHLHAGEINHKDEGCRSDIQRDENRLPDVRIKSGENHLDIKSVTSGNKTINADENTDLQLSESEPDLNIYDETKPRRLRLSKLMQQDEPDSGSERLRQGIDVLISPDVQPHRSPTRRKGVSGASYQYIVAQPNPFVPTENELDVTDDAKRMDPEALPGVYDGATEHHRKDRNQNETMEYKLERRDDSQGKVVTTSPNGIGTGYNPESESEKEVNDSLQRRDSEHNSYENVPRAENGARLNEKHDANFTNAHFIPIQINAMEHDTNDQQPGTHMKRSQSSNDMLTHKYEPVSHVLRKTSAEANLESERRYDSDQELIDSQTPRKRRVSFGTFAYVKRHDSRKHETSPLNDEVRLPNTKLRTVSSKFANDEALPSKIVRSAPKATTDRIPTIYLAEDEEEGDANEKPPHIYLPMGDGSIPKTNEGCDNFAYTADENDYQKYYLNDTDEQDYEIYDCEKSQEETLRIKKLSTQSLPVGVGVRDTRRSSWQSDDSSMPKGILKNKTLSSESLASSAGSAANDKRFKVRKDSIALFTDKHGQVGLLELKKDSANWKERLSIKKVCFF